MNISNKLCINIYLVCLVIYKKICQIFLKPSVLKLNLHEKSVGGGGIKIALYIPRTLSEIPLAKMLPSVGPLNLLDSGRVKDWVYPLIFTARIVLWSRGAPDSLVPAFTTSPHRGISSVHEGVSSSYA